MSYSEQFKRAQELALHTQLKAERLKSIPPDPYSDEGFGNWTSEVEAILDNTSLKNIYFGETWVYICVNIVARKISSQTMTINRELLKNGTLTVVPAESHSLISLFDSPNNFEGYTNFMYKTASELTLMGNAIIWRLKFHKELMLIPTEIVTIETDKNGKIQWYNVNFGNVQEFQEIYSGTIKIHPDDIIHVRLPHLNSLFWGLSPFVPGRKSVLYDKYTKEFLLNFYLKQANPGPVLEMGELANEKQAMRLLKSIELNWTGRRNQRRTMILPKGVTAKNLQQTMAEQQLTEHLRINRDDIRGLLAIPPHELGLQTSGSLGSNETKEAIKNFWQQTIIPFQNLIADSFTNFFKKELGPKTFFGFDNSNVTSLQEDEGTKADLAIKQLNFKTLNEVRAELYDLGPVPGGDTIRVGQQQQPQFPFQFGMQNIPPQIAGNVNGMSVPEEDEELQEDKEELFQETLPPQLRTTAFLEKNNDWWVKRKGQEDNGVKDSERKVLESVLNIFADQSEIAVREFKKIFRERIKQDGFLPEEERLRSELNKAFSKFEKIYVKTTVPTLQSTAEVGYDIHLNVPFNLPSMDEITALRARNEEGRRANMEARAIRNFQTFSQTTTNDILKTIERGVLNAKTLDEIAKDIFTYFGEAAPNRSKTIARTETLLAVSLGQKAAEEDATTVIPGMKKIWITAGDSRVRDSHEGLDGEMVAVGKNWVSHLGNNLEFPRDPRAPANETINCRCTWLMVPPEDEGLLDLGNPKNELVGGIQFTGRNPVDKI